MAKNRKLYSLEAVERAAENLEAMGYDVEIIDGALLDSMVFFPPDNEHCYFVAEETYGRGACVIEIENADITGTHEYSVIRITCDTEQACLDELRGQLSDGVFENSRTGRIERIE